MSSIASISKVTRDLSARSSGSAQLSTRRLGGLHSKTLPVIQTSRFLSGPILAREFVFGDGLPQFFRRGANECRVNLLWLLPFLHIVILSCSCFLRDPFTNRSTLEGDGVRICQSSARRSRATALDSDNAAFHVRARRQRRDSPLPATGDAWSPLAVSCRGAHTVRRASAR